MSLRPVDHQHEVCGVHLVVAVHLGIVEVEVIGRARSAFLEVLVTFKGDGDVGLVPLYAGQCS